jgi:hypothetical protein
MKPRGEKAVGPDAMRAAKLSHVPGVTIAEACERFGVTKAALSRARKSAESRPSVGELALAALTENGTRAAGVAADLDGVAGWIAYINKDGVTVDEIRALLAPFVTSGLLELDAERWRLLLPWP